MGWANSDTKASSRKETRPMTQPITPVVFRKWKDIGSIIALFPESPSDLNGWYCDSYEHVGQHGGADYYGVVAYTVPVSKQESLTLARELVRIGYRLKVIRRASRRQHELRREVALKFASG